MSKALKSAIEANDPLAVSKALKSVKDLNRKMPGANTPLLYACEKGADRVLYLLFKAGTIGEKKNTFPDDTPFSVAAKHEQKAVMARLLELKQASPGSIDNAMSMAAMEGRESALEMILSAAKPKITIELFNLARASKKAPVLFRLLVKHGADVNVHSDKPATLGNTALHLAASDFNSENIRALVECGGDINIRNANGSTPLMSCAEQLEWNERDESETACIEFLKLMFKLGADASLVDNFGNDAIAYCESEYRSSASLPNPKFIKLLQDAGAPSSGATGKLFDALRKKDLAAVGRAIEDGADVNRICPPPGGKTPLIWADKIGIVEFLLEAGADPNKRSADGMTPLISAARSGDMDIINALINAGADIHEVRESGEYVENAYSAARLNHKDEAVEYLKSLGAVNPQPSKARVIRPGVGSWNDFSEILVKSTVHKTAEALARIIVGKVVMNCFGQSFDLGKRAFVVVRPKGMDWCNVLQVAPRLHRFTDSGAAEKFVAELAMASNASALNIEYNDTADAATVFRAEPDGSSTKDDGWDRATLEEMVETMGGEAPDWARERLAKSDDDEPDSSEILVALAEREKFVVAEFGIDVSHGRKLEVEFSGLSAAHFDGVAFVTD